jgi:hypothetical protein
MAKVYLSARFGRQEEMRAHAAALRKMGHTITSRWIDMAPGLTAENALIDVFDVEGSDVMIHFSEPLGSANAGGGRYFELGMAYALKKSGRSLHRVILVGDREIVFHHLPTIEAYATFAEAAAGISRRSWPRP